MCSTATGGRNSLQKLLNIDCFQQLLHQGSPMSVIPAEKAHMMHPNIFCEKVHGIYVPLHHVQTQSEFLLHSCVVRAWVWSALPVQERVRAVGGHVTGVLAHAGRGHWVLSAAILLHAGWKLVSQGELLYARTDKRNACQSARFTKWADWVCRNGSSTEDEINNFLWNYFKYRDEHGCIFQLKGKDRTNYTGFVCFQTTQNSEVWNITKQKNLTYKFHLVSCISRLC